MQDERRDLSFVPRATYRIQLTEDFPFEQAADLIPYLARLGISHCYFSPYLKTRPHSKHGYDVIDHARLNPELGDALAYDRLCATLAEHGLKQLVDVVPNHIGIMGSDNRWWLDVLENGQSSRFTEYFDIDWHPAKPELANKVLVPVLGDQYGNVLWSGDLKLAYDEASGEFSVFYFEHRFPIDPATYPAILVRNMDHAEHPLLEAERIELESIVRALQNLPPRHSTERAARSVRWHEQAIAKRRLKELSVLGGIGAHIALNVRELNGTPGRRETYEALHALLEQQAYRLAYWRVAADEINYRRFFDINDLAGLRTQNEEVFEATHRQVLAWVAEGRIHGFRIDHPDGLYDPRSYLEWLRRKLREIGHEDHYLIVEKILAAHEHLPRDWPVDGTTGYDFTYAVNGLLVYAPAERDFDRLYRGFAHPQESFDSALYRAKRQIVTFHLSSELTVLANLLDRLSEARLETRDFTLSALRAALLELIATFPVYRSYIAAGQSSAQDRQYIDWAVNHARKNTPTKGEGIFEFIRTLLLSELPDDVTDEYRENVGRFAGKFQQLTAPAMAKALEDTCFYRYVRLASLNEVGGEPTRFGQTPAAFHRLAQLRMQHSPHTMLGTSTHDSKRSEDVRARINVLSEIPDLWRQKLSKWHRLTRSAHRTVGDLEAPSRNEEYLFYQTVVGTWPVPFVESDLDQYRGRIEAYMLKALREAKVNTSWSAPDEEYEEAVVRFVREALTPSERNRFIDDMNGFVQELAPPGFLNSLSQTLLKLTAPGVPDIYQGNELWDFSLVDPDNRRPVDYGLRRQLLARIEADFAAPGDPAARVADMLAQLPEGRAKLYLTWRALRFRRAHPEVFTLGRYVPLDVRGARHEHVVAFCREHETGVAVAAVGRWYKKIEDGRAGPGGWSTDWLDTEMQLPGAGVYRNVLTEDRFEAAAGQPSVAVGELFASWPVALLERVP